MEKQNKNSSDIIDQLKDNCHKNYFKTLRKLKKYFKNYH